MAMRCAMTPAALLLLLAAAAAAAATEATGARGPDLTEWKAGQAAGEAAAGAAAAREAKTAAVGKALELLEGLRARILEEGETEAQSYNKFACFCKDTTAEKVATIQAGEDQKAALVADIGELSTARDALDVTIQETQEAIAADEKAMDKAVEERLKSNTLYETNKADLLAALEALEGAIKTLKASKTPSLVQIRSVAETMRTAVLLADALGLGAAAATQAPALFLQQPANEVQMEDYKFHADSIIQTLEGLLKDFIVEKDQINSAEVKSVAAHDTFMQEKTNAVKQATQKLETAQKGRANKIEEIASASAELSTVEATLLDDKQYTNELSKMCGDTAKTWDQRSRMRADELSTLTQAIGIIQGAVSSKTSAATIRFTQQAMSIRVAQAVASDPAAMAAIEADAESTEAGLSFVQRQSRGRSLLSAVRRHRQAPAAVEGGSSRDAVVKLLRQEGEHLKSALLTAIASRIAADPFAKVKTLIQELIERLLQEAANEANQKGWCDKATQSATQKRDYAAEEVKTLNGQMAVLEATRDELALALATLAKDIQGLQDNRAKAEQMRADEKAENEATVKEAQEGLDALSMCIDLLDKFYKTAKKDSVDFSLAQQGPAADAPGAGFKIGEAYTGAQSASGGILGMLEVMKSDFTRTIEETQLEEQKAVRDHLEFMTETGKSLAEKEQAEAELTTQKEDTEGKLSEADESLTSQTQILQTSLKELLELKPACIDTGMSYADRVARREEEIAALNKAVCILGSFEQYGPTGAVDSC